MHKALGKIPPLDPLRGFVAAARHLSFTHAAEELFLTQSAVSRQVQTLEAALGVPLFVRGVRTLSLTEAGERLARAAEIWLQEYAALAATLSHRGPRPVTVTASIGMSALWLVPRLARFQQRHPDIDVRVAASNRLLELGREDVDIAIRYCANRDAPAGAERLFGETVVPVASPAIAARPLDATTLPDTTLLDFDDPQFPWLRWADWLAAMGLEHVRPRAVLVFNHYDQLIQAAAAGQGIAIGRERLVAQLVAEGRLAVVGNARREMTDRGYWLVTAAGNARREVAAFVAWLREEAGAS